MKDVIKNTDMNESGNKKYQNRWNTAETVLIEEWIALSVYNTK